MVLYFKSQVVNPPAMIYMGKDKYENEELIKYGWDRDVWFHVDKLSSAHVYLRLEENENWEMIPQPLLEDLSQLVKANSIEGNKKDNIIVIYTPWKNLKKTNDMEIGQISFHNSKLVKKIYIEKRVNEIVNRLNKTKLEKFPDLNQEKLSYLQDMKRRENKILNQKRNEEIEKNNRKLQEKKAASYDNLFDNHENQMISNEDNEFLEDDFM